VAAGERGRGWPGILALAVLATTLSVVQPALLVFVPFALLLIALPPRRPVLYALGMLLVFASFVGPPSSPYWYFERGWALLLGGWFLAAVAFLPRSGFLTRGLVSVAASFATAGALLASNGAAFRQLDGRIATQLRDTVSALIARWSSRPWYERLGEQLDRGLYEGAELRALLFPALLALGSLAALAIAWWGYRRMSGAAVRPLSPLREFRFHDGLVWLLIAGLALVLLPVNDLAERAGSNLLTFMAALYALRGVAVLLVLGGAPGPLGVLLAAALLLLLYPLVVVTTVLVGVSDTWLDIRTRRQAPQEPGA
jgi:hypothetical protein